MEKENHQGFLWKWYCRESLDAQLNHILGQLFCTECLLCARLRVNHIITTVKFNPNKLRKLLSLFLQIKKLRLRRSKNSSTWIQYYISPPDLEYRSKDEFQHPCFNPDPHTFYGKGWLLTHYMTPTRQFNLSEPQFTQKKFRNVSTYRIIVRLK